VLRIGGCYVASVTAREKVLARVADHLVARHLDHPLRVAVDGITAAGKTTFARELTAAVAERGRPALHLSTDDYHHQRAHRHRQGRDSATGYYEDAYDLDGFRRFVLAPLGSGGDGRYRARQHDLGTDELLNDPFVLADVDAVVVVDGSFLQRPELAGAWDEIVFLDTGFDAARDRGTQRDAELFGGHDAAEHAYENRYHAAAALYLDQHSPRDSASIVVVNDDVRLPRLVRIGGPARLFSYGTLQQPDVQLCTFGRRLDGTPDTLPAYRTDWVMITDPDVIAASGSNRHPIVVPSTGPTDVVAGTVFDLTSTELAAADTYEVADYRRVLVRLGSGGEAWVYLTSSGKAS
jgi:uridine kinase